ncbi:nucleoside phosphorylase domain-containing protein, partial [Glomus cerebriforme]
ANRIITVENPSRALVIERLLDRNPKPFILDSGRGFLTITGRYKTIPISIISIFYGFTMMDFFIREVRQVVDGPLVIIRLGSCGSIGHPNIGDVIVPSGSFSVTKNYDYFIHGIDTKDAFPIVDSPYNISKITYCDREMCEMLQKEFGKILTTTPIFSGLNASTDSFYSSQGRLDDNFLDENHDVITSIFQKYPNAQTMDMETFMLYHLSNISITTLVSPQLQRSQSHSSQSNHSCVDNSNSSQLFKSINSSQQQQRSSFDISIKQRRSMDISRRKNNTFGNNSNNHKPHRHHLNNSSRDLNSYNNNPLQNQYNDAINSIRSTAALVVFCDRKTNEFISDEMANLLDPLCGEACLNTLIKIEIKDSHEEEGSVWNIKLSEKSKKGNKIVKMIKRKFSV